jgi:hypothetical protein
MNSQESEGRPPWHFGVVAFVVAFAWMVWVFVINNPLPEGDGRPDPAALLADPASLITAPGTLASAVEARVEAALADCLAAEGLSVRGLAVPSPQDLGGDGYGIATAHRPRLYVDGTHTGFVGTRIDLYEEAMYGGLDDEQLGGCGLVALTALEESVATIENLPYGVDELEADLLSDPTYVEAQQAWVACMAERGHDYSSPENAIASLVSRYAGLRGDEARAFAEEERTVAADDAACRSLTLDRALRTIAGTYGERFVSENRAELESLIPTATPSIPGGGDLGTGDVQVSLLWDAGVDFDLAVRDPSGDVVSFNQRSVESGGILDKDANFPCDQIEADPVENVFWPEGGAPDGGYAAIVTYRTSCGSEGTLRYRIVIRIDGDAVLDTTGTLDPGQTTEYPFEVP